MSGRYVSFTLGSIGYCVPVDNVLQIFKPDNILQAPDAPSFVLGVISLRGEVIPVLDVRARLGLTHAEAGGRRRVLVVEHSSRLYGLLVDEVREIVELDEEAGDGASSRREFVSGFARRLEERLPILDLTRVFSRDG
jgi:purine-binding chemotaxis protein CheW